MFKSGAFKISLIYLATSLLWIFLSDRGLYLSKQALPENTFEICNSGKGCLFVIITAALLFVLIHKHYKQVVNNEESYRQIYEDNPNPMWVYDPATLKYISVNSKAMAVYGYTRDEFLAMSIADIRPTEEVDKLRETIKHSGHINKSVGWRHFKKDGTLMTVNVSSHRVTFAGRKAVIAMMVDWSEIISNQESLIKVNTELTDEKKRLSDIQQLSKIAGWDYYIDENKLVMSDELYQMFGLEKQAGKVDPQLFLKFIHPDDLDLFIRAAKDTLAHGTDLHIVHRFYLSKCSIRHIRELGKVEYRNNKSYKIRGTMQDITELKLMEHENELINSENKKLDNIITKINNMVVLVDKNSNITWVNKAYENFTGNQLHEILGRKPSEFMIGSQNSQTLQAINSAQEHLEAFAVDMVNYTKQNQPYWVNIEFTPMFENDVFVGYITVHNNITTRKEKEEEITKQNIILRDIAWLSSHEIRRPVASILGLMELIGATSSNNEKDEYLLLLNECTLQLDRIIHHINDTINQKLPRAD